MASNTSLCDPFPRFALSLLFALTNRPPPPPPPFAGAVPASDAEALASDPVAPAVRILLSHIMY